MGCIQNCACCCHRNRNLIVYLLFLLISSFTHQRFMAEGRAISKLAENSQGMEMGREESMVMVMQRRLIGSRPPRCERKCWTCGRCEAIQVPVAVPRLRDHRFSAIAYSRGDDITNYKPMCWKCKCGDFIFNP